MIYSSSSGRIWKINLFLYSVWSWHLVYDINNLNLVSIKQHHAFSASLHVCPFYRKIHFFRTSYKVIPSTCKSRNSCHCNADYQQWGYLFLGDSSMYWTRFVRDCITLWPDVMIFGHLSDGTASIGLTIPWVCLSRISIEPRKLGRWQWKRGLGSCLLYSIPLVPCRFWVPVNLLRQGAAITGRQG